MSTTRSPKHTKKGSSDNAILAFDLLSNLTYMAAASVGGASRDLILEWVIRQNYQTVRYFRQVYLLAKRTGFEYSRAFQLVSRQTPAESVRSLLLRFAGAIQAGYPERDFLLEEARVQREQYINSYYRSLETVAKWGDAYAALLVSVSLVVVVAMISTMLSEISMIFVMALGLSMFSVTGFGVYIIYRTSPYEVKTFDNKGGPKIRRLARKLFFTVAIPGMVLAALVTLLVGLPQGLILLGLALMPTGVLAWIDDGRVDKLDQETSMFIRAVGNVAASVGSTISDALSKIDRRSMGNLEPYIHRLQIRLKSNIRPELCWDAFRDEAGAELMNRTTNIFLDGVSLGGDAAKVGAIAAEFSMDAALMRARRTVSATPFAYLTIPLHFAMTGLMTFILEIMRSFNEVITLAVADLASQPGNAIGALPDLPLFHPQNMGTITALTIAALLAYTVANALAPKFAKGGHPFLICSFGFITCLMTGLNMLIIPPIAAGLLLGAGT
jgi:flagellar protein FlaJ